MPFSRSIAPPIRLTPGVGRKHFQAPSWKAPGDAVREAVQTGPWRLTVCPRAGAGESDPGFLLKTQPRSRGVSPRTGLRSKTTFYFRHICSRKRAARCFYLAGRDVRVSFPERFTLHITPIVHMFIAFHPMANSHSALRLGYSVTGLLWVLLSTPPNT